MIKEEKKQVAIIREESLSPSRLKKNIEDNDKFIEIQMEVIPAPNLTQTATFKPLPSQPQQASKGDQY